MRFTFDLETLWLCLEIWSQYTCFRNPEGKLTEFEGFPNIPEEVAEHYRALAQDINLVSGKNTPRVTAEAMDFLRVIRHPEIRVAIHRIWSEFGMREAFSSVSRYLDEIRSSRLGEDLRRFFENYDFEDLFEGLADSQNKT